VIPRELLPPVTALVFKGTHNSYDHARRLSPEEQVEDYGVWAVELDYNIMLQTELAREATRFVFGDRPAWYTDPPPAVIGHDGPGQCADGLAPVVSGGPDSLLTAQVRALADAPSMAFRPLLVYLDKKPPWQVSLPLDPAPVRISDPHYDDDQVALLELVGQALGTVIPDALMSPREYFGRWSAPDAPRVPELAGRVLIFAPGGGNDHEYFFGEAPFTAAITEDLWPHDLEALLEFGPYNTCARPPRLIWPPAAPPLTVNVVRADDFVDPWTWQYAVPPNPLRVIAGADQHPVPACSDSGDNGQVIAGWRGTRELPYARVRDAVERARPVVRGGTQASSPGQEGMGFTVAIDPGGYPEQGLHIDFPLRLANLSPDSGVASIGAPP
jgi:hypothetical protein